VQLKPIAGIRLRFWKIELHCAREVMRFRLRKHSRPKNRRGNQNCGDGTGNCNAALQTRRVCRGSPREQRIASGHEEGKTVYAGDRGQLNQPGIRGCGVAQQIPRKTDLGKMGANEFKSHPNKWGANASERGTPAGQSMDGPRKTPRENPPGDGDEKQDSHPPIVERPP